MAHQHWDVGILGATGTVGQQLARRLAGHPWFTVTWLGASDRFAGRRYGDLPWRLPGAVPPALRDLVVDEAVAGRPPRLVFSAIDAAAAADLEPAFASLGHIVVSNTRSHRLDPDVPLIVPEINPDHLALIRTQRQRRGWTGAIVANPNCSTVFLALVLGACRAFDPARAIVTTLQAASGAGHPGVPSWDLLGNVIPFIDGEEEKIEAETAKILGAFAQDRVAPHGVVVSAQATRVPVIDGHTEAIAVGFSGQPPSLAVLTGAFEGFAGRPQREGWPSAPPRPIDVARDPDRPQPRLDADRGDGMTVTVGRIRPCPVLHYRLVALGHNTVRGAAGAGILNAELLAADGWLDDGVTPW